MAGQINYEKSDPGCNAMDYPAHKQTYGMFLTLAKWAIGGAVLLLAFMALTLV